MWFSSIFVILIQSAMIANSQTECSLLKDKFSNGTAEFVACAIDNSRPITFCETCVQSYINIIEYYNKMTKFTDNNTRCIDKFINLDRLQIFNTLYASSYNLWNDAKCDICFEKMNGTLTSNRSTKAVTFQELHVDFMNCVNRTYANDSILCTSCMEDYVKLDNYYHSISNENEKIGTCMDMVDLMNGTRSYWSQKCCKYRRHDEYIFISSTTVVLISTLCFYVIAQFCTVKKAPTILQQRRFAESFNQMSNSHDQ